MSDPMTNVDIEDVLSSIRRLVSDGDKGRDPVQDPASEAAATSVADAVSDIGSGHKSEGLKSAGHTSADDRRTVVADEVAADEITDASSLPSSETKPHEAPDDLADTGWFDAPDDGVDQSPDQGVDTSDATQLSDRAQTSAAKPERFVLTPAFMVPREVHASEEMDAPQTVDHKAEQAGATSNEDWFDADATEDADHADDSAAHNPEATDPAAQDHEAHDHETQVQYADGVTHDDTDGNVGDGIDRARTDPDETNGAHSDAESDGPAFEPRATETQADDGPLELTNLVFDAPASGGQQSEPAADSADTGVPSATPAGRSQLVATIAELEAAVSKDTHDFEPDGSEQTHQAIEWPDSNGRHDMDTSAMDVAETIEAEQAVQEMRLSAIPFPRSAADPSASAGPTGASDNTTNADVRDDDNALESDELDDDLDDLMASKYMLDEEALREMISAVVREELTGPLGERITRNVRKLVRREIYRILSSQEFD